VSSPERAKGGRLESAVVNAFQAAEIKCERTWGSNGRSRGLAEHIDNVVTCSRTDFWIQCKNDEALPSYLWAVANFKANEGLYLTETENGDTYLVVTLAHFVQTIKQWDTGADVDLAPPVTVSYGRKNLSVLIKPLTPVFLQCVKRNHKLPLVVIPVNEIEALKSRIRP
jgi:hypothetical protein